MFRKMSITLLASLTVAVAISCSVSVDQVVESQELVIPDNYVKFISGNEIFSIDYPNHLVYDETALEATNQELDQFFSSARPDLVSKVNLAGTTVFFDAQDNYVRTLVMAELVPKDLHARDLIELAKKTYPYDSMSLDNQEKISLGGESGYIVEYSFDRSEIEPGAVGRFHNIQAVLKRSGKGISWTASCMFFRSSDSETCKTVVSSFRLLVDED